MVKPRNFASFVDVRTPANVDAYADLLVVDAASTDDDPSYINSLYVVQQAQDGSWRCPLFAVPFLHRRKQTICDKHFESPELVMKHIGKHMLDGHQQLGGEYMLSVLSCVSAVSFWQP